jgi:hypothetical protein
MSLFSSSKRRINDWFHHHNEDEIAPYQSIQLLCDRFIEWVTKNDLNLHSNKGFRESVCNALCTLKGSYDIKNDYNIEQLSFPNRRYQNPDWKDEFNYLWDSYLEKIYTNEVIDMLFESISNALWEDSLPNWKYTICSILPYYIKPSVDTLYDEGLIVFDDTEELITLEESQDVDESI